MPQLTNRYQSKPSITNAVLEDQNALNSGRTGYGADVNFRNATPIEAAKPVKKTSTNKDAYVAAVNKGAKTKEQMATDGIIQSSNQAIATMKAQAALTDYSSKNEALMDKFATQMTPEELDSAEGQGLIKKYFKGVTDLPTLTASIKRRSAVIEQLKALPLGTQLAPEDTAKIQAIGISDPEKYMSLKTDQFTPQQVAQGGFNLFGAMNAGRDILLNVGRGGGGGSGLIGAAKAEDARLAEKQKALELGTGLAKEQMKVNAKASADDVKNMIDWFSKGGTLEEWNQSKSGTLDPGFTFPQKPTGGSNPGAEERADKTALQNEKDRIAAEVLAGTRSPEEVSIFTLPSGQKINLNYAATNEGQKEEGEKAKNRSSDDYRVLEQGLQSIDQIESMLSADPQIYQNVVRGALGVGKSGEFRTLMNNTLGVLLKSRSGSAYTDNEKKALSNTFDSKFWNDPSNVQFRVQLMRSAFQEGLNRLENPRYKRVTVSELSKRIKGDDSASSNTAAAGQGKYSWSNDGGKKFKIPNK